ncbi:MAG: VPLPA-CTERM sorting domain-containing protein [Rhodobacteraceae bacterium]|nr:VPLPA-CTERM sorting domain-containing protein [Paracoccaceae bacterium]
MKYSSISAAALAVLLSASSSTALTFDFSWTGDSTVDTNLTKADDKTASAVGTLDINVGAGESFDALDITADITVSGTFGSFSFTDVNFAAGTIAADGLSASFTDFAFFETDDLLFFGCSSNAENCSLFDSANIIVEFGDSFFNFVYKSTADAQGSFKAVASAPVPLPAGGLLLLAALGGLAAVRRARK